MIHSMMMGFVAMCLFPQIPSGVPSPGNLVLLDSDVPAGQVKIFAPGRVSTFLDDWAIRFSPDGNDIFFTVTGRDHAAIVTMTFDEGSWSEPEVTSFSGHYFDYAPVMSDDGNRLIFGSQRPSEPGDQESDTDLWMVSREGNGWGTPSRLPSGVNVDGANDVWPCFTPEGDLVFSSNREGGEGGFDLYISRFEGGRFQDPENLGRPVNSELGEYCPFVAPDGSYLIYEIVDAPDGLGGGDMYISIRQADGSWGEAQNMGETFNSRWNDCYPCLSPDGKYFFFMSDRRVSRSMHSESRLQYPAICDKANDSGGWDIYWIDANKLGLFFME